MQNTNRTFHEYRDRFRKFYAAVKNAHLCSPLPHRGHGLDHDVTVATFAARIADNQRTADKAWVAAMIHSSDRMINGEDPSETEAVMRSLLAELPRDEFSESEIQEIITATLRHSEKNLPDQNIVQVVLMDADRLANLMPIAIIRAGQFRAEIPALELNHLECTNPKTTYRTPTSALEDIRHFIEWKDWFRTEKGKELSAPLIERLEDYLQSVATEYKKIGLNNVEL